MKGVVDNVIGAIGNSLTVTIKKLDLSTNNLRKLFFQSSSQSILNQPLTILAHLQVQSLQTVKS
jgi:hypothetical protein